MIMEKVLDLSGCTVFTVWEMSPHYLTVLTIRTMIMFMLSLMNTMIAITTGTLELVAQVCDSASPAPLLSDTLMLLNCSNQTGS